MKKIFLLFLVYLNFTYAFDIGGSAGGVELFKFNIDLSGLFSNKNEEMVNSQKSGLTFPSFNNFTDSTINGKFVEGITDERRFLVVANIGQDGKTTPLFQNTVSAKIGDIILVRAYIHNNAKADYPNGNAKNVKIGMTGFLNAGSGYHYSSAGTSVTLNQFISADNTTPAHVADDSVITSSNGSPIKLLFYETENAIQSTVNPKTINQADFFSGGSNIGTVEGYFDNSFYVYTYMRVVSGEPSSYDLKISKYVGKDQLQADTKTYTGTNNLSLKAGDFAYYRIDYENLSTSTATPVGTKVYDDYDQTKVAITWLPDACSHDGDRIICTGNDLSPNQYHTFYYIAKIKADVVANTIIVNNAEIRPTTDADTNDMNDHTNAQVKIIESGVCGGGAKTYPATTTAYPSGSVFCAKGTTIPFNPIFPKKGLSSSWLCKSKLGGIDTNCIANREYSTKYDLKIDKYVGKDINEVNLGKKEIVTKQGDKIIYKLFYTNLSSSSSTTVGTKIYDDYDETKITIVSKPQECTDDGTKLICVGYDLQPSQSHVFYYVAKVKTTISNGVKIHNNVKIKASGENDTNPANDISNARVTVNAPLNGECGMPARTYLSEETQYPAGSIFCNKGTADPSSPYFPLVGQSITWTCQGVNGESNRVCQASRTDNY